MCTHARGLLVLVNYSNERTLRLIANPKMEKEQLNISTEEVMTYFRQGVAGETSVLPGIEELNEANEFTLDDRIHNLTDFLKRPIDAVKGSWTTTHAANTELITNGLAIPDIFFENPMVREKLRGFLGFRGQIKAKIMINAQKFQQGALLMYFIPNVANNPGKTTLLQQSLAAKTGCPHVLINCEGGTEQTLTIPYVSQHMFYNMATNQGSYGKLFLTPLLALETQDSSSVGYRIQVWMENPQPQFPTSAVPALAPNTVPSQSVSQIEEASMHGSDSASPTKGGGLDMQSLLNTLKDVKMQPSYLAKSVGNAFELMGMSKPTQKASINRTSLRTNSYMANYNGEFMGHKLALAADNELAEMKAPAGTDFDEMAISALVKIPTYYKTFDISTTYGENYVLFSDLVHPMKFVPADSAPAGVLNSTFVGYTAAAFSQWRGGIKYNFTLAKTGFHSGSIRVTFLPGVYDAPTGIPNASDPSKPDYAPQFQLERCYQQTYDLRDLTEFSFTVPYTSTRPFLNNINPFGSAYTRTAKHNMALGYLVVDVFIPVTAPASVKQSFNVAVWVSGADDLIFANPAPPSIYPYSPTVISQSFSFDEGTDRVKGLLGSSKTINSSSPRTSALPSGACTGEVIASIKALCSRFGPFASTGLVSSANYVTVSPFSFQGPVQGETTNIMFNYLDYFSYLYAFFRGGTRFSIDTNMTGFSEVAVWRLFLKSSLNTFYANNNPRLYSNVATALPQQWLSGPMSTCWVRPSIEGTIEFEIPYYSLTHISPTIITPHTYQQAEESNIPLPVATLVPRGGAGGAPMDLLVMRACSDDFRFFYIVGPPQVSLLQDTSQSNPMQDVNVEYSSDVIKATLSGNMQGTFGLTNFPVPSSAPGVPYTPPNQFMAYSPSGDKIWLLPHNVAYKFWYSNPDFYVTGSQWVGMDNLKMTSVVPNLTFATTNNAPNLMTSKDIVPPAPTFLQATPYPCVTFKQEEATLSTDATLITIPAQGIITFGAPFTLVSDILVFIPGSSEQGTNHTAFLIAAGTPVEFFLRPYVGNKRAIEVRVSSAVYGYIATNIPTQTGFPPQVPVASLNVSSGI